MPQKRLPRIIPSGLYYSPFLLAQTGSLPLPKTGVTNYTYEIIPILSMHQIADVDYFFPIMKTELAKNRGLIKALG